MALAPETRFAVAAEGHHLAYQVLGDGERDLLFVAEARSPIDLLWDDPLAARALRRLAGIGRLILCDMRGFGSSDSVPWQEVPAIQAWADDIGTVLDAAGSRQAALIANAEPCVPIMLYAATRPARVSSLALMNPFARFLRGPETPWGMPEEIAARYVERYRELNGTGELADVLAPSRAQDPVFRRWYARCERLGGGPGEAAEVYRRFMNADVTGVLPSIQAPTLLLRRRGDWHVRDGHARFIAQRVPGAHLVEVDGDDDVWCSGDVDALFDEIERFLTGVQHPTAGDRVLSTVVFTDIVDSTRLASAMGDALWTGVLEAHDDLVHAHVNAFRGRLVKSTGDGALAIFDGPARAIQCALGIARAAASVGVEVSAGVHTGEIQLRDADVGGLAVHIAARVAGLARAGEVLVSGSVPPLVSGSGLAFEPRGTHRLKGVPEAWALFSASEGQDPAAVPPSTFAPAG